MSTTAKDRSPGQVPCASYSTPQGVPGERENIHRSARAPQATRRHAGHVTRCHDIAGHRLTSRLAVTLASRRRPQRGHRAMARQRTSRDHPDRRPLTIKLCW
jgi:hypothetical protein